MLQGTASSVGKSLLTVALCRILHEDGYRVAPFKAQNMALNAAVTSTGGEIGRAQAVQAEAACIAPTVEMNPILLKPEGGMRSQVVILGRSAGSMTWGEYQKMRAALIRTVDDCIAKLRAAFDVVVIEGAGSPAEINLRSQDLVNMHVAEVAEAPVLLIGDIERGGVFAHLAGTLELLPPAERARIAGLVINKFRGDAALLKPGLDFLESRYQLPILGVVPFVERLRIAEEDSVALEDRRSAPSQGAGELQIVVVRLPGISNYDDFSALEHEPDVVLSYVDGEQAIRRADLVIIPGSKTTMRDLAWLRRLGLDRPITERAEAGCLTLGICGGCQMLGERIEDPEGVESERRATAGLGLLPLTTRFERAKRTTQVRATVYSASFIGARSGAEELSGYEIHLGRTIAAKGAASPFRIISRNGEPCDAPDGAISPNHASVGTMLHGIFENDWVRAALLSSLRKRKGLAEPEGPLVASRDAEYGRLAAVVRTSLDIAAVKRISRIA
jgi:adenosylcobyric acid synthase